MQTMRPRPSLTHYAWLSIAAALATMGLKFGAYLRTRSIGLLSDALESGVNLAAAIMALAVLTIVAQPPDEEHAYGHEKAEYFSSGVEGTLILVAAGTIAYQAIKRFLEPVSIERLDLAMGITIAASIINLIVARVLLRAGRSHRSIALEADGQHLLSDVWTSVAVLMGLGGVALTGWQILDPLAALLVGVQISWSGLQLLRRSASGLMDTALPRPEIQSIVQILQRYQTEGAEFHALRTRQAGSRCFVSMHIQVPGDWSVQRGHDLLEAIEKDVRQAIPSATVFTHIEPLEDPRSWGDQTLDTVISNKKPFS